MNAAGVQLHELSPGEPGAPFVVFAHGLEGCWTSFKPLAKHLDPAWRVVSLELPWKPGNDYRWRHRSPGQLLGEGLDLLDAKPDVLMSHSFGAYATLELLCSLDSRVGRAVALIAPFYRMPHHEVNWRMFDESRATFASNIGSGVQARLGARGDILEPDVLDGMIKVALDRAGPFGFSAVFDNYVKSAELQLGNVVVPTTVLWGGSDPTLPYESAVALTAGMPGATLRMYEGYDHFFYVRHASEVAATLCELVDSVRAITTTAGELR